MSDFVFFWGGPYSQWFKAEFKIGDVTYNTCEQWMMAEKARLFGDTETLAKILKIKDPKAQKALGRQVKGFVKEVWDANAKMIVYRGNYAKFTQNAELLPDLLSHTGKVFVEASPYDNIWGIGLAADDPKALDPATWEGTNWLGEIITLVRDDIISSHRAQAF